MAIRVFILFLIFSNITNAQLAFDDVASQIGVNYSYGDSEYGGGVSFADFDNDSDVSLNFFRSFFAQMNSVANIANPTGITIIAGPGVKNNMQPINTTEMPIKNIASFRICL